LEQKDFYVLLSMVGGLGPRRLEALTGVFGNPENAWHGSEKDLYSVPGMPRKVIDNLLALRNRVDPGEEINKLREKGVRVISLEEPAYPPCLRHIYDPPRVIYIKGKPEVLHHPMFAVVGARRASYYGQKVAAKIAGELSLTGLCIVSGMARGIDTAAHMGALKESGNTVAVLGCGVDVVYPRENRKLMAQIIEKGAVISEFPPGTSPAAGNFPQRNRVISGLCRGVLVIEAGDKSGSLITVDFALEQGREVFAVPGQVTNPLNRGAHRLIKQGARLVEEAADILEELGYSPEQRDSSGNEGEGNIINLTPQEKKVYNIISDSPISSELIIGKSGMEPSEILSLLSLMEIRGLIRQLPGHRYVRSQ